VSLQSFEHQHSSPIPTQIYEGMTVYDRAGDEIGTVAHVYLGAVSEEAAKRGGHCRPGRGIGFAGRWGPMS
jgi:hypothetical protein